MCASKDSTRVKRVRRRLARCRLAQRVPEFRPIWWPNRRSLRAYKRLKGVYDPLTLWKKLPGRNDRREDTISVAGRPPDSRFARARSNRKVNRRLCLTPPNVCSTVRSPTPQGRISRSWTAGMRLSCRGPFSSPPSPSVKANGAAGHSTRVAREIPNRRMQGLTRFGISGIRIADCAGAQIGVQPEA